MQLNANRMPRPQADDSPPIPVQQPGFRAALRRTVLLSATALAPRLTADQLARRYLTSDQSVIDTLSGLSRRFEVLDLGEDTALLRSRFAISRPGGPRVLIAPGHDGHIRQFTRVVRALQKRGAAVDILIFPGHGHAARRICSLRHMVDSICRAARSEGPYDGIVAHCVAANAMFHALERGVACQKLALISVPLDLPGLIRLGGRQYGLSGRCLDRFVARVDALGAPCAIDKPWRPVAQDRKEDLLIVQALNDYAAPVEKVRPLAETWPRARLDVFENGGHNGILNVTSAIDRIAGFMTTDPR
ncbi:hypothetical protein [Antarctobacter sp.]|uniref:alpha/beta hydrolase n=1 Tax=Antarctobacter sp. TaxID=1872577 RepID=UPI002B265635|nr:hypothetical protein [Antarctobacter sp.]